MKRVILSVVGTVAGLVALLSYKTHGPVTSTASGLPSAGLPGSTTSTGQASSTDSSTGATPTPTSSSSGSAPASTSYTGTAVHTRYGIVQVKVVVSGSKITNVSFVQLTAFDGRSQQINSDAAPILLARNPQRSDREDRYRVGCDLHERRVRAVAAERARSGRHSMNTPTEIRLPRRHVEHCMGTVFSIDVRSPGVDAAAIDEVVAVAALGRPHLLDLSLGQRDQPASAQRGGTGSLCARGR